MPQKTPAGSRGWYSARVKESCWPCRLVPVIRAGCLGRSAQFTGKSAGRCADIGAAAGVSKVLCVEVFGTEMHNVIASVGTQRFHPFSDGQRFFLSWHTPD